MKQTEAFARAGWVYPIFLVLRKPPVERIHFLRAREHPFIGDFAWHTSKSPEDEFVHCTGYDQEWKPIWYADLALEELEFVCEKPKYDHDNPPPRPCPFPIKDQNEPNEPMRSR